jgi:hypothetical protein
MMPEPTAELRDSIRSAPCIYQRVIEDRRFDVRLVYIDGRIFACSIKGLTTGMVDIRKDITHGRATHERIEIPGPIAARVRDYCDRLDLRYGAFDFIVDAEDCWWFLECNSAGQFLWLEEGLPDIGLLDAFCKMFLRHMGTPFDDSIVVRLDEFRASGIWQAEQAAWPGPHKPGMIIGGFRPEDEEDLALLS